MAKLSGGQKGLIIAGVAIVVVGSFLAFFRYSNPGLFAPYKCDQGGDSTRKFYDPNWQARGAVCDGYWIPFGSKLNGKNPKDVLAKMAQSAKPSTTQGMKLLAESSAA